MIFYVIINLLLLAFVAWLIYSGINPRLHVKVYSLGLIIKLLAGFALGYMYMNYYQLGDTLMYHRLATVLANTARSDINMFMDIYFVHPIPEMASQPRAWFMVQVVIPVYMITGNNYWLASCWFSLFSFAGLYYLASKISFIKPDKEWAPIVAFLFFPSIIFWSSGIIKESLALGCIGFMTGSVLSYLYGKRNIGHLLISLIFLFILWQVKYYVAAIWILVLPPLIFSFSPYWKNRKIWLIPVITIGLMGFVSLLHPNFYLQRIVEVIYTNYREYTHFSKDSMQVSYPYEDQDALFILINAPFALLTSFFMPLWPHVRTLPVILAVIENWLLLILVTGWLLGKIKSNFSFGRVELTLLIYIFILAVFLGLSTPNLGTLSRFRVSFLPFLIWLTLADNYFLNKLNVRLDSKRLWIKNR